MGCLIYWSVINHSDSCSGNKLYKNYTFVALIALSGSEQSQTWITSWVENGLRPASNCSLSKYGASSEFKLVVSEKPVREQMLELECSFHIF